MEIYDIAIVPLIIGLVELLKKIGLPSDFGALVSVLIGILIGIFYVSPGDIRKGIIIGLYLGLTASGLYSGTKSTVNGTKSAVRSFKGNKSSDISDE